MIFSITELNTIHELMAQCEADIKRRTGVSVRVHMSMIDNSDVSPSAVLQVVADSLGMTMQDYTAQTRKARHVLLRQMASVFLRRHFPDMSLRQIGDYFGGKDHASVLHAIRRSESFLENQDELFVTKYKSIENQLFKLFTDEKANDKTN